MAIFQVIEAIKFGKKLEVPQKYQGGISNLIQSCWEMQPEKRPSFSDVSLKNLKGSLKPISLAFYGIVPIFSNSLNFTANGSSELLVKFEYFYLRLKTSNSHRMIKPLCIETQDV